MSRGAAVILISGGLDSATAAAAARSKGYEIHALTVDYGQRHALELEAARAVGRHIGVVSHRFVKVDLRAIGGSALTGCDIPVPKGGISAPVAKAPQVSPGAAKAPDPPRSKGIELLPGAAAAAVRAAPSSPIPPTYVPARNTILLALGLACCEAIGADSVWIGANAVDFSGYPDCRPEFIEAFSRLADVATKAGAEGRKITIEAPLLRMSKAEIIRLGLSLGVDYSITFSCYDPAPGGSSCGLCDACRLRLKGFREAGLKDPIPYAGGIRDTGA